MACNTRPARACGHNRTRVSNAVVSHCCAACSWSASLFRFSIFSFRPGRPLGRPIGRPGESVEDRVRTVWARKHTWPRTLGHGHDRSVAESTQWVWFCGLCSLRSHDVSRACAGSELASSGSASHSLCLRHPIKFHPSPCHPTPFHPSAPHVLHSIELRRTPPIQPDRTSPHHSLSQHPAHSLWMPMHR